MTLTDEQIEEIKARAEAATPGPWAYESVSEKSNDYCIGTVCPVDKDGDPGDPIMGNVRHHPHYFNAETGDFGEWYCEMVCSIDECEHGGDGSLHADARFIAHARTDIPLLISALEAEKKRADEAEALVERLKLEARCHAGEARTANATIAEAYQAVTVGTGEPGNWHGAEPIKAELTRLREENERYREAARGQLVVVNTASSRVKELEAEKFNPAARDVLAERKRQIEVEGWTPEHDDEHGEGELAMAAACYALVSTPRHATEHLHHKTFSRYWPWAPRWWKPKNPRADLVRAGALILAEIERLDRAEEAGR